MYTLPELPYKYASLEPYLDSHTMKIHHGKHHAAYVKKLNEAVEKHPKLAAVQPEKLLQSLHRVPEVAREAVRNNGGGHVNHSLFWQIMGPARGVDGEPKEKLALAINHTFGSLRGLQEKFSQVAMSRFGSGWTWLIIKPSTSTGQSTLSILDTPNQDTPLMDRQTPILTLDLWEHAYYLKYQNRRADYIKAWWNVVNWQEVEQRFLQAI